MIAQVRSLSGLAMEQKDKDTKTGNAADDCIFPDPMHPVDF
jgi:hypothetical protein